MLYNRLGKSGLEVSAFSFGSWLTFGKQVEDGTAENMMKVAYDNGINFFDNAEIYSKGQSEIVMGNILKKMEWSRDSFVVSSKVFWGGDGPNRKGLSRKRVVEACHAALKRLQVDYLDLYFCHRPDYKTPVEETVFAMNSLIQQGKILYWGTSEWPAERIMEAHLVARENNLIPPQMEQPQYNMFERKKMELDYLSLFDRGMGTTIWSPLASGLLTGKYNDGVFEGKGTRLDIEGLEWLKNRLEGQERLQKVIKLTELATELDMSMVHLALLWCWKNSHVSTVILGASRVSQLEENLKAFDHKDKMTDEVMGRIDEILQNKPVREEFN
ncbi:MAG: aldo/keto reductase [Bacteroidia bacterium]|nr:aldo/keto reductase [Bacteroidia bacterium]